VSLRVAGPYVVSTGLVRSGIEDSLSRWTGYNAEITGRPVIEFWPTPRITHQQDRGAPEEQPTTSCSEPSKASRPSSA
jgi:hypothetical protein